MSKQGVKIFYSYSHRDESYRESLETHISILARRGQISSWSDRKLTAGEEWRKGIELEIQSADIVILLVSADFIASDFCYEKELQIAMDRHEQGNAIVVPVILRPCEWSEAPFAKLQALPKDAKPISTWHNIDEAWLNVVSGLKKTIEEAKLTKERMKSAGQMFSLREILRKEVENIDRAFKRSENDSTARGISTGLRQFDYLTDGLHRREISVIAGRPDMGKTDLAAQLAIEAAFTSKVPVAFYSLKMSSEDLMQRFISSLGAIPRYKILRGELEEDHWPRFSAAVSMLADLPLYVDDKFSWSISELYASVSKFVVEHSAGLIVIDGLEHIASEEVDEAVRSKEHIIKSIRKLAKEFDIPVIVTLTLGRSVETRPNKRPMLADLGKWNELYDEAGLVTFLYRDEAYDDCSSEKGITEIIVAKNVSGMAIGTLKTQYSQNYGRFYDFSVDGDNQI